MYKSAAEALEAVIGQPSSESARHECRISKIPSHVSLMANGIEYCSIEVTCSTGAQYGIEAFGQEAVDLYAQAKSIMEREEMATPLLHARA